MTRPMSQNAITVLERRYFAEGEDWSKLCWRVAKDIAKAETNYAPSDEVYLEDYEKKFYDVIFSRDFIPNSPTLMNAGRVLQQLSACFVLPVEDSISDIFARVRQAALIHQSGGGTGFAFTRLRPSGAPVHTTHGIASGPLSFLKVFDEATNAVKQGGTRRGANMAVLAVWHPDIRDFIESKLDGVTLSNFNISVGVDKEFMEAVRNDDPYWLRNPLTGEPTEAIPAAGLFHRIVECAWATGDPGLIFLDRMNADNPNPQLGEIESTNPCGEQPLLPYESCNLGSINLAQMLYRNEEGEWYVDWDRLDYTARLAVRFLDNVIDRNKYPIKEIEEATRATRRIGVGVMGWAEMLMRFKVPYDHPDAIALANLVSDHLRAVVHVASAELAEQRGSYPEFENSPYYQSKYSKLRNSAPLTIAPTGTISIIADTTSGIEPIYALAFERRVMDGDRLQEVNPTLVEMALDEGWWHDSMADALCSGDSLADIEGVPEWAKKVFLTSHEISYIDHVNMQAAWQRHVPNAVSKTINFPEEATIEQVKNAYLMAYDTGCKGITIFRDNSKASQVLVAPKTGVESSESDVEAQGANQGASPTRRPRPIVLRGETTEVHTGHGELYVTINRDELVEPFEIFGILGKVNNCDKATLEAVGRMASMALRHGISAPEIAEQLRGITCCPTHHRGNLILSLPDAMGQVLAPQVNLGEPTTSGCPECSNTNLSRQEGCISCPTCGWSKC